jgi:hypothetical protein
VRHIPSVAALILVAAGGAALGRQTLPKTGLRGQYYTNLTRSGAPIAVTIDHSLSTDTLDNGTAGVWSVFSVEWTGFLVTNEPGTYRFATKSDDGSALEIANASVVQNGGQHGPQQAVGAATLERGIHPIRIGYEQAGGGFALEVSYAPPGMSLMPIPASALLPDPISFTEYRVRQLAPLAGAVIALLLWAAASHILSRRGPPPRLVPRLLVVDRPAVAIAIIVTVAVAIRIVMMLGSNAILWGDSDVFIETFGAIRNGRYLEHDPFRTLLYPYFLTAFLMWSGEPPMDQIFVGAQHVLGVVSAVCFYLAGRATFGPRIALVAALLFSMHTTQLFYENSVLSEAFFVCLLALGTVMLSAFLRSPSIGRALLAGVVCLTLTMTRPIAEWFVLIPIALVMIEVSGWRARATMAMAIAAVYLAVVLPWAQYNNTQFKFFGIAIGKGLGLFIRTFEIERFDLPEHTRYPEIRQALAYARQTQFSPATFVRDELRRLHYSAVQADDRMYRASLEAVRQRPFVFAVRSVSQWWKQLSGPLGDEAICNGPEGSYVCSRRTVGYAREPFLNRPRRADEPVRPWVVAYFRHFQLPMTLISAFAVFGAISYAASRTRTTSGLLIAFTAAYFTLLPAVAQSPQDRYRLPVDGLLILLGCYGAATLLRQLLGRGEAGAA